MIVAKAPTPHQSVWAGLAFKGFNKEELAKKLPHWLSGAEQALSLLPTGNVSIVADTAAGKTVMALLCAYALKCPTLFVAPRKVLVGQHAELFGKIIGKANGVCDITGETPLAKRAWHDPARPLVFATPETAVLELGRGRLDIKQYGLLIVDECHLAVGKYAYVPLVHTAREAGVPIIALSAELGGKEKRMSILATLGIDEEHQLTLDIPTAKKVESAIIVPPNTALRQIDERLIKMLLDLNGTFIGAGLDVPEHKLLSIRELNALKLRIDAIDAAGEAYVGAAHSAHAQYFKLTYCRITVMTECYEAFLQYVEKLEHEDATGAAKSILNDQRFQEVVRLAQVNVRRHPKVLTYLKNQRSLKRAGVTSLTFVGRKETGRMLVERLSALRIPVGLVFGGKDKNIRQQRETLAQLADGKIRSLVCTSVLEMGLNLPEVGAVVHYSVPMNVVQRKQRTGRTGRIRSGSVVFIALEHKLDLTFLYVTRTHPSILPKPRVASLEEKIKIPKVGRRKRRDTTTLDLFTQPQSA